MKFLLELASVIVYLLLIVLIFNTADSVGEIILLSVIILLTLVAGIYFERLKYKQNKKDSQDNLNDMDN